MMKMFAALILVLLFALLSPGVAAVETKTIEFPFKLSGETGSEFRTKAQIASAGTIVVEAQWSSLKVMKGPSSLTVVLYRPDGVEAVRRTGTSPLRIDHRLTETDLDNLPGPSRSTWSVKLINNGEGERQEVEGRLRISVPLSARVLVNTQFTLLSLGNALEMPFSVSVPGRLLLEANWQADPLSGTSNTPPHLTLQLVHTAQDKTYARRRGPEPLRIEQQVTDGEIDRGLRWVARIQNDGNVKVKGLIKITFTPSL